MHIADRLNVLLNEKERELQGLQTEYQRVETQQNAILESTCYTEFDNLGLSVPRIELRYLGLPEWDNHMYGRLIRTGLAYKQSQNQIVCIPLAHTWQGDDAVPDIENVIKEIPLREHAHMIQLIKQFQIPAFFVIQQDFREIIIGTNGYLQEKKNHG